MGRYRKEIVMGRNAYACVSAGLSMHGAKWVQWTHLTQYSAVQAGRSPDPCCTRPEMIVQYPVSLLGFGCEEIKDTHVLCAF